MAARSSRLPVAARRPHWSPENETLEHFERFAWTLIVPETGDRLRLREWQLGPLGDYFAGGPQAEFFQHLWEWPTGHGKSTLLAALALHHGTYCVPKPRVYVVGGVFEHARNTTNAAAGFIYASRERHGLLGAWWEPQEHGGGRILPLWLNDQDVGIFARSAGRSVEAKGGSSVEGKNPTAIFVEELHRHDDGGAAVNTLITKTIKAAAVGRVVRVAIVTNRGTNRKTKLGRLEDQVLDEKAGAIVQGDLRPGEYYIRAVDCERETVGHIWAVPEEISPPRGTADAAELDAYLEHVKRANPAEWITVKALRRVWRSLSRFERWMFLRQNANQWVTAGYAALDRAEWWRLYQPGLEIPAGKGIKVYVGLDRASKWDSTAIVPVWRDPKTGGLRVAGVIILESPRDGTRRRTREVGRLLETMRERWPDMTIVFDRNAGGGDVAEEFEEKHGLRVIDHSQGVPFDLASMRLGEVVEEAALQKAAGETPKLQWDAPEEHRELFAAQVLAAVMKETAGGRRWRGEAPDEDTQIDGFDALAMAVHMASQPVEEELAIDVDDYRIERL